MARVFLFNLIIFLCITDLISQEPDTISWTDSKELRISGQGWQELEHPFDRLPASAESRVREPVWSLGQNSAGITLGFRTDATAIKAKWTLRFDTHLNHMAYTGIKGLDLYVKNGEKWQWAGVGRPSGKQNEYTQNMTRETRDYLLYLPLYDGIDSISIGVPEGIAIGGADP